MLHPWAYSLFVSLVTSFAPERTTRTTNEVYALQKSCDCPIIWSMAAMLRNSVAVVVVVRTPLAIAMINMRKSTHGFPFLSYMSMGLLRTAGAPLIT